MGRLSAAVTRHLRSWPGLAGPVLAFSAMADEVEVGDLGVGPLALPRLESDDTLTVRIAAGDLELHPLGFRQPTADAPRLAAPDVAVALVPGLVFDVVGGRLGRGGGHYDRLLPTLTAARLVGVSPAELVVEELPAETHDVPMTHLATQDGVMPVASPPAELPEACRRVQEAAARSGVPFHIRRFPEGTKTSQDAADAIGCDVSQILKSLVFTVDDEPVLALLPGDLRLDTAKLAAAGGGSVAKRADLEVVRAATGYAAGGTPPFGHATPIRIFADPRLRRYDVVWCAGGTPDTVAPLAIDDLVRLSAPDWVDLAED